MCCLNFCQYWKQVFKRSLIANRVKKNNSFPALLKQDLACTTGSKVCWLIFLMGKSSLSWKCVYALCWDTCRTDTSFRCSGIWWRACVYRLGLDKLTVRTPLSNNAIDDNIFRTSSTRVGQLGPYHVYTQKAPAICSIYPKISYEIAIIQQRVSKWVWGLQTNFFCAYTWL